jgi:glycosyltransferase involved in cell wall biosynthesis
VRRSEELQPTEALRGRDLVVFSNDWDGDPLSKTHIMRILARDNRILWVNSIGNRAPRANTHDALRIVRKLKAFTRGVREVEKNIFVLAPLVLPLYGALARRINGVLLRAEVRVAMRHLGFRRPISWSYLPASAPVSGRLGEELVIYQCVDEFSAFSDANGRQIAELERRLLERADLVITSAERLRENKVKQNPHTVLVQHGVDYQHFVRACDPATPIPEDIAALPRPVIGFFGLIADWVDLEALQACARAHPEGTVALIGKISPGLDVSALRALPNVVFLGRKAYADLPGYCRAFDVAVNPFRVNELTLNSNPLKVREYLAAGLPVVSSPIPEVERIGLCRIAATPEQFVAEVDAALAQGAGPSQARAQRIYAESWDARVDAIRRHVAAAQLRARARRHGGSAGRLLLPSVGSKAPA